MSSALSAVLSCSLGALLVAGFALPLVSGGTRPPVDPSVAPAITSTTPADRAANVTLDAFLEVRFSEAMNASTLFHAILPSVPSTISWVGPDVLRIQPDPPGLANCTIYQVEIRVDDVDEGLPLISGVVPNPWTFMTACDRPWIVSTIPADGETNVRPDVNVIVTFSEPMDCLTLRVQFNPALPSPSTFVRSCDTSRTVLTLRLTGGTAFLPGTTYITTASGQDDDGSGLEPSPTPNPWRFAVNEQPMVGKPSLSASGCLDSGSTVLVTWVMSDDLEAATDLTVRLLFLNGTVWQTFGGPSRGFPSNTSFPWTLPTLDVSTRIRVEANDSAGGLGLNESDPFRIDTGPPWVVATNPMNGAGDVPIAANLSIRFSEAMNRSSVEAAITAVPPLWGAQFTWASGDARLTIRPGGLPDRKSFRVTIAGSVQDTCGPGRPMGADFSFTFTTAKAPAWPPSEVRVVSYGETSITLEWERVTVFVTGSPISPNSTIAYQVFRGNDTQIGQLVIDTTATRVTDLGLRPATNYTYRIVAIVDGVPSSPTAPLAQRTQPPFFTTTEGRLSLLVSLAAFVAALVLGGGMRQRRRRGEAEVNLTTEIEEIVAQVLRVRTEPNPALRHADEEALQARFRGLVEGEDPEEGRPHPRLEGLYRALAEALVHSPEVDIFRGRELVDARLGAVAANLRNYGAAYRLLSEGEASMHSELFRGLPESARKALLLVYFYALEEYLSHRLRVLVPPGATVLLGDRGHINVRRRGWEQQWSGLSLGNLLYLLDHNRHLFLADEDRWEEDVEPFVHQTVDARNRTAHPSREAPPLDRVRELIYTSLQLLESVLKAPKGLAA